MADIRQNSAIKDDFDYVESPLSNGGKWSIVDSAFTFLQADGSTARTAGAAGAYGWSYWTPDAWDGDEAEGWACYVSSAGPTLAWDLLLVKDLGGTNAVDGYLYRIGSTTGGRYTELYRLNNGGPTLLSGSTFGPFIGGPISMSLVRRNGTSVEGWYSPDSGATWILRETAVDTAFTTGLYAGLGLFGSSAGWDCFGGGPASPNMPQIYRIIKGLATVTP